MKGVRLARSVLKTSSAPPSFLLPAFAKHTTSYASPIRSSSFYRRSLTARAFSSSSTCRATGPSPTEDAPSSTSQDAQDAPSAGSPRPTASAFHSDKAVSDELSELFPVRKPLPASRARSSGGKRQTIGSLQGQLFENLNMERKPMNLSRMVDDNDIFGANSSVRLPPAPVRLDPFVGRSEDVIQGRGLGIALRMLDVKVRQNRIKADLRQQKFHERPGLKRKRLKQQRWRKRFKDAFQHTVKKVLRMRNMGW